MILSVAGSGSTGLLPALAGTKFEEGVALYNKRQFASAAKLFDEYLKSKPGDGNALYYRALTYQQMQDFRKAKETYLQVLSAAPGSAAANLASQALRAFSPQRASATTQAYTSRGAVSHLSSSQAEDDGAADATLPDQSRIYFTGETNHMVIDAQINGRPMQMLFDTGAPGVCVGKEQLAQVGLRAPDRPPDGVTGGATNNSQVNYWMMTAEIKVGPIARKNVTIEVLDTNKADALLGQSFFKGLDYTIDSGSKSILFTRKGRSSGRSASYSVPFTFRPAGNRIIVDVQVNGRSTPMIFDTGNSSAAVAFANKQQFEKLGMTIPADARITQSVGVTGEGSCWRFNVPRVKLGPIDKSDVEVTVGTEAGAEEPLLGLPFIEGWQYTIDMKSRVIRLVRR